MPSTERPVITLLTDFGLDGAAAVCRGVMLSICRDAQIVDIAHSIRKYAIADGAWILRAALPYMPVGVHVAVVDPGVGTHRRPIAVRTARGDLLVGPDNGLLLPPAAALGGIDAVRELANADFWLPETTSTFHGRDIFAPVGAHLAAGSAAFEDLGPEVEPELLVALPEPQAHVEDGEIHSCVTYVDSFGNVRLAGDRETLARAFGAIEAGTAVRLEFGDGNGSSPRSERTQYVPSFGHVEAGSSLLYVDSSGGLAFADNQGNAAARLEIATGMPVTISRA